MSSSTRKSRTPAKRRAPAKRKPGRPTKYTPALAAEICARLMLGESLRTITADAAMPSLRTVVYWLAGRGVDADVEAEFVRQYARAREIQAEIQADEIVDIADDAEPDSLDHARLRIETRKWTASKLVSRYRERIVHEGGDTPIKTEDASRDPQDIARRIAFILEEAARAKKGDAGT